MMTSRASSASLKHRLVQGAIAAALLVQAAPLAAQQQLPIRPGEAFVTRFSGIMSVPGPGGTAVPAINPGGIVGSVVDLRNPGQPPQGQHWINESQRILVTAADTGQVFGVTLDDANPPNIYLSATAAFGLHRTQGGAQWAPGMWGQGGPGAIYRLGADTGYQPSYFAQVTLNGRQNSGAALGNISYDRWNKQLYVTDMESGMIHRIRAADGTDLGVYDHGTRGRANFFDAPTNKQRNLPPIPFNPSTQARIADCPTGQFDNSPECWNVAPSGRRTWGVGVWRNGATGEVRLYYAVWSGPAFDPQAWAALDDEDKRNSVWSIGLGADGSFNVSSIRREFLLPDFFVKPEDIARAGFSQPVSDIAFPACPGVPLMIVAERGGMRNLGLSEQNPFATPHEARALRYELHQDGVWRPIGRYEVGFYDRSNEGDPRMRANCAGGASFGPGYTNRWSINQSQPDNFVWITGDALCSPEGPCNLPASGGQQSGDDSEVHGVQGLREDYFAEVAPASAYEQQAAPGETPAVGIDEAYLFDVNINMTPAGAPIMDEFVRNDSTMIGDIAIYQLCAVTQPAGVIYPLPPAPPLLIAEPGHDPAFSHSRYGSHGQEQSHFRFASHWPAMSHNRFGSHQEYWSHNQFGSHNLNWSHNRFGSHSGKASHNALASHQPVASHFAVASKVHILNQSHKQFGSHSIQQSLGPVHTQIQSNIHILAQSNLHKLAKSNVHTPIQSNLHNAAQSNLHNAIKSNVHSVIKSNFDKDGKLKDPGSPVHSVLQTMVKDGKIKVKDPVPTHSVIQTLAKDGKIKVKDPGPVHSILQTSIKDGKLKDPGGHNAIQSSIKDGKIGGPKDPVHGAIQSSVKDGKFGSPKDTGPVHNAIQSSVKDGKFGSPKDSGPIHSTFQSSAKDGKFGSPKDTGPVHNAIQSSAADGKLKFKEPPPTLPKDIKTKEFTPAHSVGQSAAANSRLKVKETLPPPPPPTNLKTQQLDQSGSKGKFQGPTNLQIQKSTPPPPRTFQKVEPLKVEKQQPIQRNFQQKSTGGSSGGGGGNQGSSSNNNNSRHFPAVSAKQRNDGK